MTCFRGLTYNEATRPTFVRTRPALHKDEAEAANFGLEATLGINIPEPKYMRQTTT